MNQLPSDWPDWLRTLVVLLILAVACSLAAWFWTGGPRPPSPPGPRPPRIGIASLAAVAIFAASGCAHPIDGVIAGLNGSQRVLTDAHSILTEQHRRERDDAVTEAETSVEARVSVAAVHARYRARWDWYEKIRAAWIAAAAVAHAVKLAETNGGTAPDITRAQAAALNVAAALQGFAVAISPDLRTLPTMEKPR